MKDLQVTSSPSTRSCRTRTRLPTALRCLKRNLPPPSPALRPGGRKGLEAMLKRMDTRKETRRTSVLETRTKSTAGEQPKIDVKMTGRSRRRAVVQLKHVRPAASALIPGTAACTATWPTPEEDVRLRR
ncbi:unnamed protein product, partial [Scytosiphon promiscuus]